MNTIHVSEVKLPPRQRQHFGADALDNLIESIKNLGLLHPIVLREEAGEYFLVAGERRLRAVKQLHAHSEMLVCNGEPVAPGFVPYTLAVADTEIEAKEVELQENIMREDLTWQEREAAFADLHALRSSQNPGQTLLDTAGEIASTGQMSQNTARKNLARAAVVAEHLDDPEVAKARNANDAFALIAKREEQKLASMLHDRGSRAPSRHTLLFGDLAIEMGKLEPGRFTTIIADPPYGIAAHGFGNAAKLAHEYDDSRDEALDIASAIFSHGHHITADDAHLFLFCDVEYFCDLRTLAAERGWQPWRTPVLWMKGSKGHAPAADYGPRRSYELILFARKGNKRIDAPHPDNIYAPTEIDKDHAAQKPSMLYEQLLRWGTIPGDEVLDPCCGRGTIFLAAQKLGLKATGIEKSEATHLTALATLRSLA